MSGNSAVVPDFTEALTCPVCRGDNTNDYLNSPYCESVVEEYLFGYYNLSGNLNRDAYADTFRGIDYVLAECATCGALFQRNRPGPRLLEMVYDSWISTQSSGRQAYSSMSLVDSQHYFSEALKLVATTLRLASIPNLPELRVLDHGMGNGAFALALKACLVDVSGTEFAANRIAFGKENGIRMYEVSSPLPHGHFHLINTEQVMEHIPDPWETIRHLVESLAPGGILKISVPFNRWVEAGERKINWDAGRYARYSPMPLAPLEHLNYYSRRTFDTIAKEFGLRRVHIRARDHIIFGLNWTPMGTVRNFGRVLLHERLRNYVLLQKPLDGTGV